MSVCVWRRRRGERFPCSCSQGARVTTTGLWSGRLFFYGRSPASVLCPLLLITVFFSSSLGVRLILHSLLSSLDANADDKDPIIPTSRLASSRLQQQQRPPGPRKRSIHRSLLPPSPTMPTMPSTMKLTTTLLSSLTLLTFASPIVVNNEIAARDEWQPTASTLTCLYLTTEANWGGEGINLCEVGGTCSTLSPPNLPGSSNSPSHPP